MIEKFGLRDGIIERINSIFIKHPNIIKVIIYGSRAKGNYKEGSDIDVTLLGDEISFKELAQILDELDELMLPYTFDISVYQNLKNDKLREHIDRVGKVFYESNR
jgi:predicted nucleotidyltransferase